MARFTFNYSMTYAQIDLGLAKVQSRSAAIVTDIHKMSCSVLAQWAEDGNAKNAATKAAQIVNGVDYHAQALANWFGLKAGFEWDAKEKTFTYTKTKITADEFQQAKAETFKDVSPPQEVKALDILARLNSVVSSGESRLKAKEDKRNDDDLVTPEELNVLKDAALKIEALRG